MQIYFPFYIFPEVEWLDHMGDQFSPVLALSKLISKVIVLVYLPTKSGTWYFSPHACQQLLFADDCVWA